jgi:hypothetical protein
MPEIKNKSQNTNYKTQTITNDQNSNVRNDSSDLCRGCAVVSVIEIWNLIFVCHLVLVIWDLFGFCLPAVFLAGCLKFVILYDPTRRLSAL